MVKVNKETMNKVTDITMILDRSGSMGRMQEQVIRSFNDFLVEQKSVEGEAKLSLIQFDNQYEVNYTGVDIQEAEELNAATYVPRSATALNDAIGRTITSMKARLKDTKDNVVVVITTDGLENASVEYRRAQIRKMIQECEQELGWKFIYLAADDASFAEHEVMGMERSRSFRTGRGKVGYDNAAKLMSKKLAGYRAEEVEEYLNFTENERQEADEIGDE